MCTISLSSKGFNSQNVWVCKLIWEYHLCCAIKSPIPLFPPVSAFLGEELKCHCKTTLYISFRISAQCNCVGLVLPSISPYGYSSTW